MNESRDALGHNVLNSDGGRLPDEGPLPEPGPAPASKLKPDREKARPSERLRQDGEKKRPSAKLKQKNKAKPRIKPVSKPPAGKKPFPKKRKKASTGTAAPLIAVPVNIPQTNKNTIPAAKKEIPVIIETTAVVLGDVTPQSRALVVRDDNLPAVIQTKALVVRENNLPVVAQTRALTVRNSNLPVVAQTRALTVRDSKPAAVRNNTPLVLPPGNRPLSLPPGSTVPKIDKKTARELEKLRKSGIRADKTGAKLGAAREKLAAQKPPKKPGPIKSLRRAAGAEAWAYVHGKIYQVEEENVGIKAAHRTELAGESVVRGGARFIKHRIRTRPARRVRKFEKKDMRAQADFQYRKMTHEHPELKKNAVSRHFQKQRIKKQYQKQAREAAKKVAKKTAEKTATAAEKLGKALAAFVKKPPVASLIILLCLLLVLILHSCMGSVMMIGNGLGGGAGGSVFFDADGEGVKADLAYAGWEADITAQALNAANVYQGYDEYRYSIDPTGHDPNALVAFLTAKYIFFTYADAEPVLRGIFDQQYSLTFSPSTEIRYRTETVTETWTDEDGVEQSSTYEIQVPYEWYVLTVTLTARSFEGIITPMLTTGEREIYDLYMLIHSGN